MEVRKITDGKSDAVGLTDIHGRRKSSNLSVMPGPVLSDEGEDGKLSLQACDVII